MKGAYERRLQNILNMQSPNNVLCIVSIELSIFALKHQFHEMRSHGWEMEGLYGCAMPIWQLRQT